MDAIILSGGEGSRMEDKKPKLLVEACGKPILYHQLNYFLKEDQINNIIISLGYKAQEIIDYIKTNFSNNRIKFCVENEPLGTGGAVKKALELVKTDSVIIINGDNLTDIPLSELVGLNGSHICVAKRRSPFGKITENEEGYAVFEEKPFLSDWTSCGWYFFYKEDLENSLPEKGSLEYDVFPNINLKLFKHEGFCKSLNTKKDIQELDKEGLPEKLKF